LAYCCITKAPSCSIFFSGLSVLFMFTQCLYSSLIFLQNIYLSTLYHLCMGVVIYMYSYIY
jgi:hypothetical protein